jgi:hypothetical protein
VTEDTVAPLREGVDEDARSQAVSEVKPHAAIIGGMLSGLTAGVALARRGSRATIVERDMSPPTDDGDEAFLLWDRRNVPQFRQPPAFSARSRNLPLEYIPEAVDRMGQDGIDEVTPFKMLAPAATVRQHRAILDDPTVVEAARQRQSVLAAEASGRRGPSRAELIDCVAAAPPGER